jgi:hypothetical protein
LRARNNASQDGTTACRIWLADYPVKMANALINIIMLHRSGQTILEAYSKIIPKVC